MWPGPRDRSRTCIFYSNIFSILLFLVAVAYIRICTAQNARPMEYDHIKPGAILIKDSMEDILHGAWKKVESLEKMKQENLNHVNYEVGYLIHIIHNKYRKMIDRYHTAADVIGIRPLFLFDVIILLEEVEHGVFQMDHIIRMLSQVEKKYGINTPINEPFIEKTKSVELAEEANIKQKKSSGMSSTINFDEDKVEEGNTHPQTRIVTTREKRTIRKKFNWTNYYKQLEDASEAKKYYYKYTKRPVTRWWWPLEYGWEIDKDWG